MAKKKMSWDDIEKAAQGEIDYAEEYEQTKAQVKIEAYDRYRGRPMGNEKTGRSKFQTRDVMDTIEAMMPTFQRTFAAGDHKIELEVRGKDPKVGKALMAKIYQDLSESEPNHFTLFYTWFKEALVMGFAVVKTMWNLDQERVNISFDELSQEQMLTLEQDPDADVTEAYPEVTPGGLAFRGVRAKIVKTNKDRFYAENTPHWEFIMSSDARSMNDEHPKGQRTKVSLDYLKRINRAMSQPGEKQYFQNLDDFTSSGFVSVPAAVMKSTNNSVEANYREDEISIREEKDGLKKEIELIEWYTRLDVNNDGYLEPVTLWLADRKLLRYEENKEGFVPYAALSPIIDCHKMIGIGYGELLQDIQEFGTMFTRRMADNFDFCNLGRWLVDPGGHVNVGALLDAVPGEAIFGKPGSVTSLAPPMVDFNSGFAFLELKDKMREQRSGIARSYQGLDPDATNKTATGIQLVMSAAQQRIDLVSLVFAYTGIRDFYKKAAWLYQRYQKRPFTVDVNGEDFTVQPEDLQGEIITKVSFGIDSLIGQQELQKLERSMGFLFKIGEQYPGIIGPDQVHAICSRYVHSMGWEEVDDFIAPRQAFNENYQKTVAERQQAMQMQMQLAQADQQAKAEQLNVDAQLKVGEQKLKALDIQADNALEQERFSLDKWEAERKNEIELLKLALGGGNARKQEPGNRGTR